MLDALIFFSNKVIINGLVISSIYAMGSIGISLIFFILRFAHFAHADIMTLGAGFTLLLTALAPGIGLVFGIPANIVLLPLAILLTVLCCLVIDRLFYRPLRIRRVKPVVILMASIGVALMLQGLIRLAAGTGSRTMFIAESKDIFRFRLPEGLAKQSITITEPQVWAIIATCSMVIWLHFFLIYTKSGKAMRAMADNPDLAVISGIPPARIINLTWVIAGSFAAIAGTLLAMDVSFKPDLSFHLLLSMFAATIVGGIGRPFGAILGALVVGFVETIAVFNWAVLLRPIHAMLAPALPDDWQLPAFLVLIPSEYKLIIPFILLIFILIWRPTGLIRGEIIGSQQQ